jgi:hypothetical protein
VQIPVPKSSPRIRRDSNAKPKLAAIQQIDTQESSYNVTARRASFDATDDVSILEQFHHLPKSNSGHVTLNGNVISPVIFT